MLGLLGSRCPQTCRLAIRVTHEVIQMAESGEDFASNKGQVNKMTDKSLDFCSTHLRSPR